jgi:signal transduction histidine kinase/CheY-like chemotaxis protein
MSLRTRVFALFVVVLLPAVGVHLVNERQHRASIEAALRRDAQDDAVLVAAELSRLIAGVEHTLRAISRMPAVREQDAGRCNEYVKDLRVNFNGPAEIGVSDLSGQVFCLSRPIKGISIADRAYFRRALASKTLSVGEFAVGRAGGEPAIHFGYPVESLSGTVNGVAFIPLNLAWLRDSLAKLPLPPNSSVFVADRNGKVLAAVPPPRAGATRLPDALQHVLSAPEVSSVTVSGPESVGEQVVGFVPLGKGPEGLFVAVSLSKAVGLAPAEAASSRASVLVLVSLALAFLLASFISHRIVHRPLQGLVRTAKRLRAGDLRARAALPASVGPEFQELGSTFDELASSLELREEERARHEAELRRARDEAQAANRSKTHFLAAVSHDLRQPLHSMALTTSLLNLRLAGQPDAAISARLQTSVSHLAELVNTVLDISQLDAGLIEPALENFPVDTFLQEIAQGLSPEALARGIAVSVQAPAVTVRSDPRLLRRVLDNLLVNAIKYSPGGGTVRFTAAADADAVVIQVSDDGPGIPLDKQKEVWEEFRQLGNAERNSAKGLGLGLAIVRRMADLLGHEVTLDSDGVRGTTFSLRVARADGVARERAAWATPVFSGHVLLVEDDSSAAESTAALLEAWGLKVVACASAESALGQTNGEMAFDVLITDYRLPGQSGADVVRSMKARGTATLCIIMTGDVRGSRRLDVPDDVVVLSKPVNPEELASLLEGFFAGKRRPRTP